jgi:hypothetical protein
MVCISYLDIRGNPAHLHYLLRRLHERLPDAELLVGFWPPQDPILTDPHLRQTLGGGYCVSTLKEAVESCVAAPHKLRQEEWESVPTCRRYRLTRVCSSAIPCSGYGPMPQLVLWDPCNMALSFLSRSERPDCAVLCRLVSTPSRIGRV